jgi:hypothetical protein
MAKMAIAGFFKDRLYLVRSAEVSVISFGQSERLNKYVGSKILFNWVNH